MDELNMFSVHQDSLAAYQEELIKGMSTDQYKLAPCQEKLKSDIKHEIIKKDTTTGQEFKEGICACQSNVNSEIKDKKAG